MNNKVFLLNKNVSMPGHVGGNIVYQNEIGNYTWETAPFYEMSATQVELDSNFFTEVKHDFSLGETCYFVDSNGRIYEVPFDVSKHASLLVYKNIFKNKSDVILAKSKMDEIFTGDSKPVIHKEELQLLRSIIVNSGTKTALLLLDKMIEQIT